MKDQFVTYEIALKLKKVGFNNECMAVIDKYKVYGVSGYNASGWPFPVVTNNQTPQKICAAPLWQQAIDWLREKHSLCITIAGFKKTGHLGGFDVAIGDFAIVVFKKRYDTYEQAREAAMLKALELIK